MSTPEPGSPQWLPDPLGRHELRFWDGERWTEHVSDHGVPTSDALGNADIQEFQRPKPAYRSRLSALVAVAIVASVVGLLALRDGNGNTTVTPPASRPSEPSIVGRWAGQCEDQLLIDEYHPNGTTESRVNTDLAASGRYELQPNNRIMFSQLVFSEGFSASDDSESSYHYQVDGDSLSFWEPNGPEQCVFQRIDAAAAVQLVGSWEGTCGSASEGEVFESTLQFFSDGTATVTPALSGGPEAVSSSYTYSGSSGTFLLSDKRGSIAFATVMDALLLHGICRYQQAE